MLFGLLLQSPLLDGCAAKLVNTACHAADVVAAAKTRDLGVQHPLADLIHAARDACEKAGDAPSHDIDQAKIRDEERDEDLHGTKHALPDEGVEVVDVGPGADHPVPARHGFRIGKFRLGRRRVGAELVIADVGGVS